MKTPFFSVPRRLVLHALITLLIGVGCTWPLLQALGLVASLPLCMFCCAAVALLYALLDCMPRLHFAAYPLLLLALALLAFSYAGQVTAVYHALALFVNGQPLALAAYSRAVTVLLAILFTSVGASLARSDHAFFTLVLVTVGQLLVISLTGLDIAYTSLLPLVAALLLTCRAPSVPTPRLLAMAASVLAITFFLLPHSAGTIPELNTLARKLQQTIDDYFFFTEPRTAFSLNSAGWQPYGQDRLGGTVTPTDEPVMQVKVSSRALLRATVKNEYTGLAWADTTSGRRYLFISPRFASLRGDLFDQHRPEQSLLAMLPGSRTITVRMLADAASTLFVTQRFLSPKGEGIVSYFAPSSELFATRSLAGGDVYTFSGRLMDASSPGVRAAVLASMDTADPYADTVKDTYLQLPASVEPAVYQLAQQIAASAANDFDRAAALCLYLQQSFPYSLTQSEPPVTRDFVSWFLFEEKRGYCTSFASSLTVLARAAGLPARYVEGFAAEPDSDGVARVTRQNAHAWTEIYFPGFGWLPFDPTPGAGSSPDSGSNDENGDPQQDRTPSPDDAPQDTPTPSPFPTPSPTPEPTPSPTPEHNDPSVTPTPPITPPPTSVPTPEPAPTPPVPPDGGDDDPPWLLLLLLVLVLLAAARLYLTAPARVAALYSNSSDQLLVWYQAVSQALACMELPLLPGEAPATYLLRAQNSLGGMVTLIALGKAICVARYSGRRIKSSSVQKAEQTYRALFAQLTPLKKFRLFALRFVRGLRPE